MLFTNQNIKHSHISGRNNFAHSLFRNKVTGALATSEIHVNGQEAWDILVRNEHFYKEVVLRGSLGLGESYMDGWWECHSLDQFFCRIFTSRLNTTFRCFSDLWYTLKTRYCNRQSPRRASRVDCNHYDIGNDLYRYMLDRRMMYSCGFWKNARTLDEAQEAKLCLVLDKLQLKPGMRLLDIGCGWGGTASYAAKHYGVKVVGVTISREQAAYAEKMCQGLDVTIRFQDYRDIQGTFDRIVSIGMFEHVGVHNYRLFMETAHRLLTDNGIFLLHTIGGNTSVHAIDPWINRYIFPNAVLPSAAQISAALEGLFVLEDWHSFGPDYDKTLMAWYDQFEKNRDRIPQAADKRFYRMWKYYLLSCAASFRTRKNQVWQIILTKQGLPGGYQPGRCLLCFDNPIGYTADTL